MIRTLLQPRLLAALALPALAFGVLRGVADETKADTCFYTGQSTKPELNCEYEGVVYGFHSAADRARFDKERSESLYQRLGGKAALDAAVDLFYVKLLADERVNFLFDAVNMKSQIRKQKEFLAAAFGSPVAWTGKDLREAHANLDLREADFTAIAENLQAALVELKLDEKLVAEVMSIAGSAKDAVLNR